MSITTLAQAQRTAVLPGPVTPDIRGVFTDHNTAEGNGGGDATSLGVFTNTVLQVYNEDLVLAAGINPGDVLTGISFRVSGGPETFNPAPNFQVDNYLFSLGHSLNSAGNLVDNFDANAVGGALTQVRSGALEFNAADYPQVNPNTGTANAFGPVIEFNDSTFTYTGGDLLLEYSHTGAEALNGSLVRSRADTIASTVPSPDIPDFGDSRVQTFFGAGFDAPERSFATVFGDNTATIVQFQIAAVPEPTSAALLMGLGMIGVVRSN